MVIRFLLIVMVTVLCMGCGDQEEGIRQGVLHDVLPAQAKDLEIVENDTDESVFLVEFKMDGVNADDFLLQTRQKFERGFMVDQHTSRTLIMTQIMSQEKNDKKYRVQRKLLLSLLPSGRFIIFSADFDGGSPTAEVKYYNSILKRYNLQIK